MCQSWKSKKKLIDEELVPLEVRHGGSFNIRRLWGELIIVLREKSYMSLHTACGEIRDVSLKDNVITAKTDDETLFSILSRADNLQKIRDELSALSQKLTINFELNKSNRYIIEENKKGLVNLFGEDIKFKGEV